MLYTIQKHPPKACNVFKKEILARVFSCEFCKIFSNTFFTKHLRVNASGLRNAKQKIEHCNFPFISGVSLSNEMISIPNFFKPQEI